MNPHSIKRGFQWTAVIAPLILWGILATVVYSHGDEERDEGAKKAPAIDTTGKSNEAIAMFSASLDSVYAVIGAAYKTVEPMLRNSCYDCHSSQTDYPWYHAIPGVKQMIDSDIEEARKHLDLDKGFPVGGHAGQLAQLREIREVVEEGEMPLFSYRMMHWNKKIEGEKQQKLFGWIDQSSDAIKEVYSRYRMPLPKEDEHAEGADDDDHDGDHDANDDAGHDDDHDHDEGGE